MDACCIILHFTWKRSIDQIFVTSKSFIAVVFNYKEMQKM